MDESNVKSYSDHLRSTMLHQLRSKLLSSAAHKIFARITSNFLLPRKCSTFSALQKRSVSFGVGENSDLRDSKGFQSAFRRTSRGCSLSRSVTTIEPGWTGSMRFASAGMPGSPLSHDWPWIGSLFTPFVRLFIRFAPLHGESRSGISRISREIPPRREKIVSFSWNPIENVPIPPSFS